MLRALPFAAVLLAAFAAQGEDIVTILGGRDGKQTLRRTGTIDDYTGDGLVMTTSTGRQEKIPAERVLEIVTTATAEETSGDKLRREAKLEEAIAAYRDAKRSESRGWVQRRIMAKLIQCHELQGELDAAGDEFLALLASDPGTIHFAVIPLPWRTSSSAAPSAERARNWLATTRQVEAELLGASWLLTGADRSRAVEALKRLSGDLDPRIAHLASAQLWRTAVVTATPADLSRWQAQIERMPAELRAGPLLVLGDGLARNNQLEDALLAWLHPPLVFQQREVLAAQGLLAAAAALDKAARGDDAQRLYRELLLKHPVFSASHDIESRIRSTAAKP